MVQTPSYRQLSSRVTRMNLPSRLSSDINKLKQKRDSILREYNTLKEKLAPSFRMYPEPLRRKCHYDYFLEESVLMANDFLEERKWKIQVAYILAHEAQAFFYRFIEPARNAQAPKPLSLPSFPAELDVKQEGMEVEDEKGKIGEGTHERFIVQADRFQKKADAKL